MDLSELFEVCLDFLPVESILVATMNQVCQVSVEVNNVQEWKNGKGDESKDRDEYAHSESNVSKGVVLSNA